MLLLFLWACTGGAPSDTAALDTAACVPVDDPAAVTWDNWGEDFFTSYCDSCHASRASDRRGAPEYVVFDTEAQVVSRLERIRVRVLEQETMPVGGGVFPSDLTLLATYLECAR